MFTIETESQQLKVNKTSNKETRWHLRKSGNKLVLDGTKQEAMKKSQAYIQEWLRKVLKARKIFLNVRAINSVSHYSYSYLRLDVFRWKIVRINCVSYYKFKFFHTKVSHEYCSFFIFVRKILLLIVVSYLCQTISIK